MKTKNNKIVSWLDQNLKKNSTLIGVLVVIIIGVLINGGVFLSVSNITNVGRQATIRGLLA